MKETEVETGFFFRMYCVSFKAKKRLVAGTFMSMLDGGDINYMHAFLQCLHASDTVHHGGSSQNLSLCVVCSSWIVYLVIPDSNTNIFIYTKLSLVCLHHISWPTLFKDVWEVTVFSSVTYRFLSIISWVHDEQGSVFKNAALSAWNQLQKQLKWRNLVSYNTFKEVLNNLEARTSSSKRNGWLQLLHFDLQWIIIKCTAVW